MMKRALCLVVCVTLWAASAWAQDSGPNPSQSVTYYVNFIKETTTQLAQVHELLEQEKKAPQYPYTDQYVFYSDLAARLDQTTTLLLDLCDLYYIYHRATYCFAKEEKNYLLSRVENTAGTLKNLAGRPFVVDTTANEGGKAKMQAEKAAFADRMQRLLTFIPTTLGGIKRD